MSTVANLQAIPLNRLVISKLNVRRTDRKADIDALAASIASHGLLQNLSVIPLGDEKYEVVAGGRRLAALKSLARTGAIAREYPVPCRVLDAAEGREASLTENVHRVAMDVMDEVEAFAALEAAGSEPDEIARRFGVATRHVEQRLALANLSPKLKAAWKRGDINLDCLRAFCLVDDHGRQEAVLRSLGRPITHASSVRARLMDGSMRGNDRIARFVGLDAYEAADGRARRDLFDADAVFIEDPALMFQLAEMKLEQCGSEFLQEGWGWLEVSVDRHPEGLSSFRIQPEWRDPTPEEQAEIDRLRADLDKLDAELDADSVEDDPRWEKHDDLSAAIETIRQAARVWNPAAQAHAGILLTIDHDGELQVARGLVRQTDEKVVRTICKRGQVDAVSESMEDESALLTEAEPDNGWPKQVLRDLSMERTRAIRLRLARSPAVALAVAVAGMLSRSAYHSSLPGVDIVAHALRVEDHEPLNVVRAETLQGLPESDTDILAWCLQQPSEGLMTIMAVLVAGALDLSHERGSPADRAKRLSADQLTQALAIDMRSFWAPDEAFWGKLPKSGLLAALAEAPEILNARPKGRDALMASHARMKKGELAARAHALLGSAGYLPDLLVTPLPAGALELTDTGETEIAA